MTASTPLPPAPDQALFEECYRGRQSSLQHMAYMRMAKVLVALQVFRDNHLDLSGKHLFDYGFGAGTLFRYCPRDAFLSGVEQDAASVREVQKMLQMRGYQNVDLQTIDIATWMQHPLLKKQYDMVVCSHVLEHLPRPEEFLSRIAQCLRPDGGFLGIVPINERVMNPHHVMRVTREKIVEWAERSGLCVDYYAEFDPVMYWLQPLFNYDRGVRHKLARMVSIGLGVPATLFGARWWWRFSGMVSMAFFAKPTQAAFIMRLDRGANSGKVGEP